MRACVGLSSVLIAACATGRAPSRCEPNVATTRIGAGGYIGQKEKAPDYVVPDLTGFKLKPYVAYQQAPKS